MLQHTRQKVNLCEGGILPKKAGWDSGGHHIFCQIPPGGTTFLNLAKKCGARHCSIPPFLEESRPRTS